MSSGSDEDVAVQDMDDVDPSLWAAVVARGRALRGHWEADRPGHAPGFPVRLSPLRGSAGRSQSANAEDGHSLSGVSDNELSEGVIEGPAGRRCACDVAQSLAQSDLVDVVPASRVDSIPVIDLEQDEPISLSRPVDTTFVPDLRGPEGEENWYRATAAGVTVPSWNITAQNLDCLDLFAGGGVVSTVFRNRGYCSDSYDVAVDPAHDILAESGFRIAVQKLCRVRPGGLVMAGPPCSLWTFMSSSVHRRTSDCPGGDTTNWKVRMSNAVVDNLVALLCVACDRGVYWVVEQPATSRMWDWPPMAELLANSEALRVHTVMGAYGHRQTKPTVLRGTLPTLRALARTRAQVPVSVQRESDPTLVGYKRDSNGRVTGNKHLHQSAT